MNLSLLGGYDFKVNLGAMGDSVMEEYVADYEAHVVKAGEESSFHTFKSKTERDNCIKVIEVLNKNSYWGSDWDDLFRKEEHRGKPFQTDEIVVFNGVPAKLLGVSVNEASILRVAETRSETTEHYLKLETTQRSLVDGYYIFQLKLVVADDDNGFGGCQMRYTKVARVNDDVIYPLKVYMRSILAANNEASVKRFETWVVNKIEVEST